MSKTLLLILAVSLGASTSFSQTYTSGEWSYTLNESNEATITSYSGADGAVIIPSSVGRFPVKTVGGGAAIFGPGNISVTIPNSVAHIGERAFYNCVGLTSVSIPNSVTTIGVGAFFNCHSLANVVIPASVTTIGKGAFAGCYGLTSVNIPNSVTSIGDSAFESCSGLTSVNIPNSVTNIGGNAFALCSSLTSVNIPDSVTVIDAGTFASCYGLTSVNIGNSVTSIEEFAFASCYGLLSVTIPDSVTGIGAYAFTSCDSLTSVIVGNSVTIFGEGAFSNCRSLTSVLFKGAPPSSHRLLFMNAYSRPVAYYLPSVSGWTENIYYQGLPLLPFIPSAQANIYSPATGFRFSWTGTGSIPMNVSRATSPAGPWNVVSTNNATGQFTDTNPPTGQAFYRASLP